MESGLVLQLDAKCRQRIALLQRLQPLSNISFFVLCFTLTLIDFVDSQSDVCLLVSVCFPCGRNGEMERREEVPPDSASNYLHRVNSKNS